MAFSLDSITPRVRARLNDQQNTLFTDTALLPYAQDTCTELQNNLQLYGIQVLKKKSAVVDVAIGATTVTSPADLLVPIHLEERSDGTSDLFTPMTLREWEPNILPTDSLRYWVWREQVINLIGATSAREVKIWYFKLLLDIDSITDTVTVNNSELFVITKIAALAAKYIGENDERYEILNQEADAHMKVLTGIAIKSKQGTRTRRRPFALQGYRRS